MSLAYALPFFCDAMLYFGALGLLGLLGSCRSDIYLAPLMLLAGCWLSGKLTGRGKPWLRWLPMAAVIPCMVLAGNLAGRVAVLPMAVYLPLYVMNNRRAPDYDYTADRFRYSLIVAGVILLVAVIVSSPRWKDGLPYLFLYCTLNIALLRLLRHDDRVARSGRFRVLNALGVGLVCAAGFGLAQPGILAAIRAAWLWFLDNVVLRLVTLILYLIQWAFYLVGRLFALLGLRDDFDLSGFEPAQPASPGEALLAPAGETATLSPFLRFAVKALGLVLLAGAVFLLLRALSRRVARVETGGGADTRESLDAEAPKEPRARALRRDPEAGVRHWYRRALLLARSRGGRVAPTMNTLQILEENAPPLDPDAMQALRALYLPVRYGEQTATKENVRRAREAYERLKKKSGE